MRYRIEYLEESTDEFSVCHALLADADDLDCARLQGWRGLAAATRFFDANGFQVREAICNGIILTIDTFDLPMFASVAIH